MAGLEPGGLSSNLGEEIMNDELEKCPKCQTLNGVCYHCKGHAVMCINCGFKIMDDENKDLEFETIEKAYQVWNLIALLY